MSRQRFVVSLVGIAFIASVAIAAQGAPRFMNKIKPISLTVQQSRDGFAERRNKCLAKYTQRGLERDIYGGVAIGLLVRAAETGEPRDPASARARKANAHLRFVSQWFDHPHPNGRDHKGECDFAAIKLSLAWHLLGPDGKGEYANRLEPATLDAIRRFFLTTDFQSKYHSENHDLLFYTSRYLMGGALPDDKFEAYDDRTGAELAAIDREWLADFIRYRARRGWGEFDSGCYINPDMECLLALHDDARDPELRKLAGMMIDLVLTDGIVDSRNGMVGGAHGRIYSQHARDHNSAASTWFSWLYFGNVAPPLVRTGLIDSLVSSYRPDEMVLRIGLDRESLYENRERKHLHNMADVRPLDPLDGSIRKLTRVAPEYILGCVQRQDPYPEGVSRITAWYARHEQHDWDLTIPTRTTSRIFTHHPGERGNEHGFWTGDLGCCCGSFFQNGTALVALYDIPKDQPCQFIHAYVPRAAFGEVVEEDGVIFLREGRAYAALRMLGGHQWTTEGEWKDQEVVSPGAPNAAVCEVATVDEYAQFAAFKKTILATLGASGDGVRFDKAAKRLTYRSTRSGTLTVGSDGLRQLNGKDADLDYKTYDCPWLQSEWDSGVVEMRHGGERRHLDFIHATDTR